MKTYINLFHEIIDKIHFWDELDYLKKKEIIKKYVSQVDNPQLLTKYFENYLDFLKKNTLNSYIKSVINP